MQGASLEEADSGLPPPGSRWGAGAHSVLPYLSKTLQARPAAAPEPREPHRPAAADAPDLHPGAG